MIILIIQKHDNSSLTILELIRKNSISIRKMKAARNSLMPEATHIFLFEVVVVNSSLKDVIKTAPQLN